MLRHIGFQISQKEETSWTIQNPAKAKDMPRPKCKDHNLDQDILYPKTNQK